MFSGADPNFYQIVRDSQGLDPMRNVTVPACDLVKEFSYTASGGNLDSLFDGKERVISVDSIQWNNRPSVCREAMAALRSVHPAALHCGNGTRWRNEVWHRPLSWGVISFSTLSEEEPAIIRATEQASGFFRNVKPGVIETMSFR